MSQGWEKKKKIFDLINVFMYGCYYKDRDLCCKYANARLLFISSLVSFKEAGCDFKKLQCINNAVIYQIFIYLSVCYSVMMGRMMSNYILIYFFR